MKFWKILIGSSYRYLIQQLQKCLDHPQRVKKVLEIGLLILLRFSVRDKANNLL